MGPIAASLKLITLNDNPYYRNMQRADIYTILGCDGNLLSLSDACKQYPDYSDLANVTADFVCFVEGHPIALYMDIADFSSASLARVAEVLLRAWNYRMVQLLVVISETEIRVYNCYALPRKFVEDNPQKTFREAQVYEQNYSMCSDDTALHTLLELFSVYNLSNGNIWTKQQVLRHQLDKKNRVDAFLVECLKKATNVLKNDGLSDEIIHALLIRSLFILFLEDKGATAETHIYEDLMSGSQSYFDILEDKDATYRLFEIVNDRFNGNITPLVDGEFDVVRREHLQVVKRCFYDGNVENENALFSFRLFDFKVIRIEVLSEIYEHFLGETKQARGQYYTPANVVRMMMKDNLPIKAETGMKRVLDPACGSGIFLVEAFKHLIRIYKLANHKDNLSYDELKKILLDNIYGIDLDNRAIKVAAFSLYLALIDELDPRTLWADKDCQLPNLVYDASIKEAHRGRNLLCTNTITDFDGWDLSPIDLLIGNPPYGTKVPNEIRTYCNRYHFALEQVIPFMHKAVEICPNGKIALMFNSKVLTNTNNKYRKFRDWLFNDTYVEKLYNLSIFRNSPKLFGGSLFADATVPVAIAYYRATPPVEYSPTITYCAPKTYIISNVFDGIVIDSSDIKYIYREFVNSSVNIWKASMWANMRSYKLASGLLQLDSLRQWIDGHEGWVCGRGVNRDSQRLSFVPSRLIDVERVLPYASNTQDCTSVNDRAFRAINEDLIVPPFVFVNQGLHRNELLCSLIEGKNGYFTTSGFSINGPDYDAKKLLVAYLNSSLVRFLLFLTASSWAIERETVMLEEVLKLPSPFERGSNDLHRDILSVFDRIVENNNAICSNENAELKRRLDQLVYQLFDINETEQILIEDVIKYSLGLFAQKGDSDAIKPVNRDFMLEYAHLLTQTLHQFVNMTNLRCSATIYEMMYYDPLTLVVLQFGDKSGIDYLETNADMKTTLSRLDKELLDNKVPGILFQKDVKYYDSNKVYILKRNQKRFWTKSMAMDDASIITADILNSRE